MCKSYEIVDRSNTRVQYISKACGTFLAETKQLSRMFTNAGRNGSMYQHRFEFFHLLVRAIPVSACFRYGVV